MAVDAADVPKIITVAAGFCVRQEIDNLAWIDVGGYAIVVDALEHAAKAGEVFAAIGESLPDTPVRYLLNTHTHYDHTALNSAFEGRYGTEIINQHTSRLGRDGRWFEGTRRRVLMLPMPGCHTREDCIIWAPDEKVLFVGDIFGWGLIPLTGRLDAASAELLLGTYAKLIAYEAEVVVPGHGPLCATAELQRWVEYFHWLIRGATAGARAGCPADEIAAGLPPPEDMADWWRFRQWKHADSVSKVISAAGRGGLPEDAGR